MRTKLLLMLVCPNDFAAWDVKNIYDYKGCKPVRVDYTGVNSHTDRILPEVFEKRGLYV